MKRYLPFTILLAFAAAPCGASVIFFISSQLFNEFPGSGYSTDLQVYVENDSSSSITVGAFSFEVTITGPPGSVFTGLSGGPGPIFSGSPVLESTLPGQTIDVAESDSAGSTLSPGETRDLGLMTFNIAPTTVQGEYAITFTGGNGLANSLTDLNGNPIPIDSLIGATINVVPEPSSISLMLSGACFISWMLRKKRRVSDS